MDLLWLVFLAGLAVLPPIGEIHKQLILLGLAIFQLSEGRLLAVAPRHGATISVGVKLALATLLLAHTGGLAAINSSYYPIFYVPVVTAAMLFGPWGTVAWTAASSAAYLAYLWPALYHFSLDVNAYNELALRVFFLFLVALLINRFALETRGQRDLYRQTAESLEIANRQLRQAQVEARRAERLAALGQLSAGLAHEIRNPLAVIKGSAEMLEKTVGQTPGANPTAAELAGFISSEVNRVNLLVSRFLDFARPIRLERQEVALAPLLDRALADAQERWPRSRVRVEREYAVDDATALPKLELDATLCERAFANLAANAFEAMDGTAGEPTLRVRAEAKREAGQEGVVVEFRDTGPGVPEELREEIFNPFFTTKPSGVGLGLAIVSKIVDQHGGQLRLRSAPGEGAVFEVFLPAADGRSNGDHTHRG